MKAIVHIRVEYRKGVMYFAGEENYKSLPDIGHTLNFPDLGDDVRAKVCGVHHCSSSFGGSGKNCKILRDPIIFASCKLEREPIGGEKISMQESGYLTDDGHFNQFWRQFS